MNSKEGNSDKEKKSCVTYIDKWYWMYAYRDICLHSYLKVTSSI